MSPLPKFHSKANKEAEARTQTAKGERDKASSFLESLDNLLQEVAESRRSK